MTDVKARNTEIKGCALVRDKDGNPKIDKPSIKKFWPYLSKEDKAYMKTKYEELQTWR